MKALIVLDTMRKDYGEYVIKYAGLNVWDRVVSTSTWTGPAHVSMFTGLYPSEHGVKLSDGKLLPDSVRLSKRTRKLLLWNEYKMRVLALSSNFIVSNIFGYDFTEWKDFSRIQGIPRNARFVSEEEFSWLKTLPEHYQSKIKEAIKLLKMGKISLLFRSVLTVLVGNLYMLKFKMSNPDWPLDMGGKSLVEFLETLDEKDVRNYDILFINLMEMHEPYDVPDRKSRWKSKYKEEAEYEKTLLRRIVKWLTSIGVEEIYVVGDHGQLLGEHGMYGHTTFPYEEVSFVPFGSTIEEPDGEGWISLSQVYDLLLGRRIEREKVVYSEFCGIWHKSELRPKWYIGVASYDRYGVVDVENKNVVYGDASWAEVKPFVKRIATLRRLTSI